jgi:prepilin-type N-terminal cleavage/methylation domain-containing protein
MRTQFRGADEGGFSLMEVVVAMAVFAIFCAASVGLLVRSTGATRGNIQRTAASNLLTEQIQIARSMTALTIPTGVTVRTEAVSNTTYTITQTAKFLSADSTSSVCDGSGASLAYKLVTVVVTWPEMGSIKPVTGNTLKAVGIGTDGLNTTGALALGITGSDGTSESDITVTLNNGTTAITGDDGCALFVGLPVGVYSATINQSGYVGSANVQAVNKTGFGVVAGALTRGNISYDKARSFILNAGGAAGAIIPAGLSVRISGGAITTPTVFPACSGAPVSACATGPITGTNGLAKQFFPAIYTVKFGTCVESGDESEVSADLTAESSEGSTVTVPMGTVAVNVTKILGGASIAGKTITARHVTGCTETFTTPSVAGGTTFKLPYGSWTISTPTTSSGTTLLSVGVTLRGATPTAVVPLVVTS